MEIKIKKLENKDLERVKKFYEKGIEELADKKHFYPYEQNELISLMCEKGGLMLGAEAESELIALSAIDFDRKFGEYLKSGLNLSGELPAYELSGVMVKKDFRGRGIAAMLLKELIKYAEKNLAPCLIIGVVEESNFSSQALFKKEGFENNGLIMDKKICPVAPHLGLIKKLDAYSKE